MKKQLFVIHGGDSYNSYEEYFEALKAKQVSLESLVKKGWKIGLQEALGDEFEVVAPTMPCKQNAKYVEWKVYFEKFLPLLRDDVIFVGHSLGGIFLTKYFSENVIKKSVQALLLVAAPYNTVSTHPLASFVITEGMDTIGQQVDKMYFYHSTDDLVVSYSNYEDYKRLLPHATFRSFTDKGHFNQEAFPEIVNDIINL